MKSFGICNIFCCSGINKMFRSLEINKTISFRGQPHNSIMRVAITVLKITFCLEWNSARSPSYNTCSLLTKYFFVWKLRNIIISRPLRSQIVILVDHTRAKCQNKHFMFKNVKKKSIVFEIFRKDFWPYRYLSKQIP